MVERKRRKPHREFDSSRPDSVGPLWHLSDSGFIVLPPKIDLKLVLFLKVAKKKYAWDLCTNSTLMQTPQYRHRYLCMLY